MLPAPISARSWRTLGAHPVTRRDGSLAGVRFAVWAPGAREVSLVGDFCGWDPAALPMRRGTGGVWRRRVPGARVGDAYRFEVLGADGVLRHKADPLGRQMRRPPDPASIVTARSRHAWGDAAWIRARRRSDPRRAPIRIYEVHLGSWRRRPDGGWLNYAELGELLAEHCTRFGFTHVELMPIAEHPFDGSWGYQVTGYYAPTSRFGTPDDLRAMVDTLHRAGIGILLDWVPGHFPRDEHGLARFDGTPLYEPADQRRAEHPEWGTLTFDYARPEVRAFLIGNARYWLEEFHFDGLRVDAVASMLYLDYSRKRGQWTPNRLGGNHDLDAIDFLRELTGVVRKALPGVVLIAEESTAFPGVTAPIAAGGLGFHLKWDMGWMQDTLGFFGREPAKRGAHLRKLTFRGVYLADEHWVLPLSHDEVVHLKRSLLGKMPGTRARKFANLRSVLANQLGQPGKKLLFMGSELAPDSEWNHDFQLPWALASAGPLRSGLVRCLEAMGTLYRNSPALWANDGDPDGFAWIGKADARRKVVAWLRRGAGQSVVVIANLGPLPLHGYRVGMPEAGAWVEALNTDALAFGGGGVGNPDGIQAQPEPLAGMPASASLSLPALGTLLLRRG